MSAYDITPAPTDEEAAAIAAALVVAWPRTAAEPETAARPPAWRFAGRWWGGPVAVERSRPWRR